MSDEAWEVAERDDRMWSVWQAQVQIAKALTERLGIKVELDTDTRQYVISGYDATRFLERSFAQDGEQSTDTMHNPQTVDYEESP